MDSQVLCPSSGEHLKLLNILYSCQIAAVAELELMRNFYAPENCNHKENLSVITVSPL